MKTTINERLRELREALRLNPTQFAVELGVSSSLIQKIETGEKPVSSKVVSAILSKWSVSQVWLQDGKGEMTPEGKIEPISPESGNNADQWQRDAFTEIRSKNQILEKEIERVWKIVHYLTNTRPGQKGEGLNFYKSFGKEAVSKRYQKTAALRN